MKNGRIQMIKFILRWFTNSRYFGMKREHLKIFEDIEELIEFRKNNKIMNYEMYKEILCGEIDE